MKPTPRTILTHSLLVPLALTVAAALAACAGESAGGGNGVPAAGSAGQSSGSAGAGAATGAGAGAGGAASAGGDAGAAGGAGQASGGAPANVPAVAKALICPLLGPAFERPNAQGSSGQVIPPGFSPVAVVQCGPGGVIAPVVGERNLVRKEVAVADLQPLLTALGEPSARRAGPGPQPGCPVLTVAATELALIGRDGTVIYPRIPVTVCGSPIQPVTASLAALHWIPLSTTGTPQVGQPQVTQPQVGQGARTAPIVVQLGS
jgi:hypothetical protein